MEVRYYFNQNGWRFTFTEWEYEYHWSRSSQYENPAHGWWEVELRFFNPCPRLLAALSLEVGSSMNS